MIPTELAAKIRRLFHVERWPVGTIARQCGVHHQTVRRALLHDGVPLAALPTRRSKADPFVPFIVKTLEDYPGLHASRLYEMVKERGYDGGPDYFRTIVGRHRPRKAAEAFLRLSTLPAEQALAAEHGVALGTLRRALELREAFAEMSKALATLLLVPALATYAAEHDALYAAQAVIQLVKRQDVDEIITKLRAMLKGL